jgi:hypothetical protein
VGAADDLNEAVRAAQAATCDLLGVLVAHGMVPGILNLRLAPCWPRAVQAAYVEWEDRISDIARVLARRRGMAADAEPDGEDGKALLIRAYVLGLDLGE